MKSAAIITMTNDSTTHSKVCKNTTTTLLQPFNGLFSRTTWTSQYQKGKTGLDSKEARIDGVLGWQ